MGTAPYLGDVSPRPANYIWVAHRAGDGSAPDTFPWSARSLTQEMSRYRAEALHCASPPAPPAPRRVRRRALASRRRRPDGPSSWASTRAPSVSPNLCRVPRVLRSATRPRRPGRWLEPVTAAGRRGPPAVPRRRRAASPAPLRLAQFESVALGEAVEAFLAGGQRPGPRVPFQAEGGEDSVSGSAAIGP